MPRWRTNPQIAALLQSLDAVTDATNGSPQRVLVQQQLSQPMLTYTRAILFVTGS